jgi:hypothetical protein
MTKEKIYNLLISLVFIPVAAIGQYLGFLIGDLYVYFQQYIVWFGNFQFVINATPFIVSGLFAAWLSSYLSKKIFSKLNCEINLVYVMIIPVILILLSLSGTFMVHFIKDFSTFFKLLLRDGFTLIFFYIFLKNS